jgi:hypothetical protein
MNRTDWAWQPEDDVKEAILRGNAKVRKVLNPKSSTKEVSVMAKKVKSKAKAKTVGKKKLDGKKLAAQRKPRDSVAQFIKDELMAGRTDVDKIVEKAKKEYPKTKPTNGYVRWIAKSIGKEKAVAPERAEKKAVDPAS